MSENLLACKCGSTVFIIKTFDEVVSIELGKPEWPEHSNEPSARIISIEESSDEFIVICKRCSQILNLSDEIRSAICYR